MEEPENYWVIQHLGKGIVEGEKFETLEKAVDRFKSLPWSIASCVIGPDGAQLQYWGMRGGRDQAMLDWWQASRHEELPEDFSEMFGLVVKDQKKGNVRGEFFQQATLAIASYQALPQQPAVVFAPGGEQLKQRGSASEIAEMRAWWEEMRTSDAIPAEVMQLSLRPPVILNVYNVTNAGAISRVNGILRHIGTGAYHAAVEVDGIEYSFGGFPESMAEQIGIDETGVFECVPRGCEAHKFRESILMGRAKLAKWQVRQLLDDLRHEWKGWDYNLLSQNCCHFSDSFCKELGVGPIPGWVLHAASKGLDVFETIDEGIDLRAQGDGYQFGDLTTAVVHRFVKRGQNVIPLKAPQQSEGRSVTSFPEYIAGVLSKKWLP